MEQTIQVADKKTLDAMMKLLETFAGNMAEMQSAINAVKTEVASVKSAVGTVNNTVNTVNTNLNNVKSSVGNLAADVADAGDYVISAPKVLMTTIADATGYPSTSHVYASDLVSVTGRGFILLISHKIYGYSLYDLVIDGIPIISNYETYAHKPAGIDVVRANNGNNILKPIYFNKSISFRIAEPSSSMHGCIYYQVGLK